MTSAVIMYPSFLPRVHFGCVVIVYRQEAQFLSSSLVRKRKGSDWPL